MEIISTNKIEFFDIRGVKTVNNGIKTIVLYMPALKAKNLLINEKTLTKINLKNIFYYWLRF